LKESLSFIFDDEIFSNKEFEKLMKLSRDENTDHGEEFNYLNSKLIWGNYSNDGQRFNWTIVFISKKNNLR
jgi:hypothetical protein